MIVRLHLVQWIIDRRDKYGSYCLINTLTYTKRSLVWHKVPIAYRLTSSGLQRKIVQHYTTQNDLLKSTKFRLVRHKVRNIEYSVRIELTSNDLLF